MSDFNIPFGLLCLGLPLFFCFLPIAAVGALFFFLRQFVKRNPLPDLTGNWAVDTLNSVMIPDPLTAQENFAKLQAQHPNIDRSVLVKRIIDKAAFNAGFVGFLTGAPGLTAMPVTMPIDLLTTGRIQASMLQTIAFAYGRVTAVDDEDISTKTLYMFMVTGEFGAAAVVNLVQRFIIQFLGKSVFEVIPVLGGFVGYFVNSYLTRKAGEVAVQYFSGNLTTGYAQAKVGETAQTVEMWLKQQRERLSSKQNSLAPIDSALSANQTASQPSPALPDHQLPAHTNEAKRETETSDSQQSTLL